MNNPSRPFRLIHVSDLHFWQFAFHPFRLLSKRLLGMGTLLVRRARKFRLERVEEVVNHVLSLQPDHLLVTGDLTTTALPAEFRAARRSLSPWLEDPRRVTILPGNHDRYTTGAHRNRRFEAFFGEFAPASHYPWIRWLDSDTALVGLDPTRASLTARGWLPRPQLERLPAVLQEASRSARRLVIACHYPLEAPPPYDRELAKKPLINAPEVVEILAGLGPHVYCCGHVHAAWAFVPHRLPNQLSLNAGAPLLRDRTGTRPPGFLEIRFDSGDLEVVHHFWGGNCWGVRRLHVAPDFFPPVSSGRATLTLLPF
jgi:predicted MPP superfamily phosphohydrolase